MRQFALIADLKSIHACFSPSVFAFWSLALAIDAMSFCSFSAPSPIKAHSPVLNQLSVVLVAATVVGDQLADNQEQIAWPNIARPDDRCFQSLIVECRAIDREFTCSVRMRRTAERTVRIVRRWNCTAPALSKLTRTMAVVCASHNPASRQVSAFSRPPQNPEITRRAK